MSRRLLSWAAIHLLLIFLVLFVTGSAGWAQDTEATSEPAAPEPTVVAPTAEVPTVEPPTLTPEPPTDTPTEPPTAAPTDAPPTATELPTLRPTDVIPPTVEATLEATAEMQTPTDVLATAEVTEAVLTPSPSPTPTLEATVEPFPAEPELTVLVDENFDNGSPFNWPLSDGWELTAIDGGQALARTANGQPSGPALPDLYNVVVEARVQIVAGGAEIAVRQSSAGDYAVVLSADGYVVVYRSGVVFASGAAEAAESVWRTVRVAVIDDVLTVRVDGQEVIAVRDEAPLPAGQVRFAGGQLYLDDVQIAVAADEALTLVAPMSMMALATNTFTVNSTGNGTDTNTADGICQTATLGECTLRAAIQQSNATSGLDTIAFNISGSGVQRITALSLPTITDPVIIDGYTQPGAAEATDSGPATILIELYGRSTSGGGNGLSISAGGSTVRGLSIGRFDIGIAITGSGGNTIEGNYVGTNAGGMNSDFFTNFVTGVSVVNSPNNLIGGTTSAARNIISGNGQVTQSIGQGILISGASATGNVIQGNYVGPNAAGTNYACCILNPIGIELYSASNTTIGGSVPGARNLISGNYNIGIWLRSSGNNNTIQGNYIGTDATGMGPLWFGNRTGGISVASGVTNTKIISNVISNNDGDGIGASGNGVQIQGNLIGVTADGTTALPNGGDGIALTADNAWIGGATAETRNIISGNGQYGIYLLDAANVRVQGNTIGTDITGTLNLGNTLDGIIFYSSSGYIGGIEAGEGNVIAYNGGVGVGVRSTGVRVFGNSIFENAGLGIDHTISGVNAPTLNTVAASGSDMLITGTFVGSASVNHRVEFFANATCDPAGNGEGQLFLGAMNVATNSGGNGSFTDVTFPIQPGNLVITATVTNNGTGTTSEFSNCRVVTTSTTVTNTNDSGPGSFREAITVSNASEGVVDTITFAIPGSGTHVISLASALPEITDPVIIDATTEGGYAGAPRVEINGAGISGAADGLHISAGNSTVKGLAITQFSEDAIELEENGGNTIAGNFVGLGLDGTTDKGNGTEEDGGGIYIDNTPNNVIGGTTANSRNVVSGNIAGIGVYGPNATGNVIQGNTIGLNAAGTAAVPNTYFGVTLYDSSNNTVGGTTAAARNVISGNGGVGVWIAAFNVNATGNTILGNYIGLNAAGTSALGNGNFGVYVGAASGNTIGGTTTGARNVIAGNTDAGIGLFEGSFNNTVQGNTIGLNAAGTTALTNDEGIWIDSSPNNQIGGLTAGARNIISGNTTDTGVLITGANASGNRVQGNYIGTNPAGMATLGNSTGVAIIDAPNNVLGGTDTGAGNLVSGNVQSAIYIAGAGATGNQILGNAIGADAQGEARLGNGGNGIYLNGASYNQIGGTTPAARNLISRHQSYAAIALANGATGNQIQGNAISSTNAVATAQGGNVMGVYIENSSNNTIGGTQTGAGNLIRDNVYDGVWIVSGNGNAVLGNLISANGLMSIDVAPDGQNPNDTGDADTGANNLQNTPVLLSATNSAGTLVVSGTLNTTPNMPVRVEFFADYGCSPGRSGGSAYLGFTNVTTDAAGNTAFVVSFPYGGLPEISATATDAGNNTSEYSACAFVTDPVRPTAAPALVTPVASALMNDNTPTLAWNPVANATAYELQIAASSSFSPVLFSTTVVASQATTTVLTDRVYYWRVRGVSSAGAGAWSSARTFTVDTLPPGTPNLSSPANAALTSDTTPTLSWGAVTGANRYRVELALDSNFTQPALAETQINGTSLTLANPGLAQGVYYWRVQAGDAANNWGVESVVRSFRLFIGTAPADGAFTTDTTPTFTWTAISGASGYRLDVATDPSFTSLVTGYPINIGAVSSYTPPSNLALPAGDIYYWRVLRRLPTLETPQVGVFRTLFVTTTAPGAPVQNLPLNAGATNDTTPTLSWNAMNLGAGIDIIRYEVQVAANSSFTTSAALYVTANGAETSVTLPVMANGTLRYWRVRAVYGVNTVGAWSSTRSFTVDTVAPGAPNLSSPANAALTSDTTPTLSWGSVSGANRYRVELATDSNFTQPALAETQINGTSLTLANPGLAQGVYYWRVQAGDAADNWGPESAVRSFRIDISKGPANGAFTTDTTPTFSWAAISGASGYRLDVATDPNFSSLVAGYPVSVGATTSYTPPSNLALPAGDTYYWRIIRRLPTLETPQTDIFRTLFVTTTTPGAPVLNQPLNAAATNDTTPTLSWNAINLGAGVDIIRYEVQVAANTTFSSGLAQYATANGSETSITLPELPNGLRYWRVRAIYGVSTVGAWSSSRTFTVDTVAPGAPNLSSPANAASISDTTPTLSWGSVSGANRYRIEVALDSNFTQPALPEAQVSGTSYTPANPGLAQGVYYWRVQAGDAADNWGAESLVRTFRLLVGTSPADGAFTSDTTPTFSWTAISGASGYRLDVATDPNFSSMVTGYPINIGAVASYTPPSNLALPAGDTYYWRVLRRLPTLETPQAGIFRVLMISSTPVAPVLVSPANGAVVNVSTPVLDWNPVSVAAGIDVVRYEIQIAANSSFSSGVVLYATANGGVSDYTLPPLGEVTRYWRVRAIYGVSTVGSWSSGRSFRVDLP